jgi:NAD(P)-dependent dehydrogenase (short-subunit alcohol dehydrogenase family)
MAESHKCEEKIRKEQNEKHKTKWKSRIHYRRESRPRFGDCARPRQARYRCSSRVTRCEKGEAAAAKLRDEGITAESLGFDVTKSQDHQKAYDYFAKKYGRLDILVNNAGVLKENQISVAGSGPNPVSAVSPETLRETFETNFFAPIALTQKLLPLINKAPAGRIVNVSSILSSLTLHSDPNSPIYAFKTFAYDASKAALNSFTVHLAYELRDNKIKVNSAHPGWVKTEMGGPDATMEVSEGGKTSAQLATLANDGPSGGFFHLGKPLPW